MLVLQVFIMRNGAFEGTEMVQGERVEMGRDPTCALVLDDDSCSRRHAVLFEHDGKLAIQDLGSANGTRVNGEPVTSARYLGPRDDVAVGVFTVKIKVMSGQKPSVPQPIAATTSEPTRIVPGPSPQQLAQMMAQPQPSAPQQPQPQHSSNPTQRPTQPVPQPSFGQQQPQGAPGAPPWAAHAQVQVGGGPPSAQGSSSSQPRPSGVPVMPQSVSPNPSGIIVGAAPSMERTQIVPSSHDAKPTMVGPSPRAPHAPIDAAQTEASRPSAISSSSSPESTVTVTQPSPPPVPPVSHPDHSSSGPRPMPMPMPMPMAASAASAGLSRDTRPVASPTTAAMPDVTAPDAQMPALAASSKGKGAPVPMEDFPVPDDGDLGPLPSLSFTPQFLDDELHDDDEDDVPWSLVQRLVRPTQEKNKDPLLEVVHYRGELVVDHQVLREGDVFKLGERMTRAERRDHGIAKVIPIVRLKKGGVAEVFQHSDVQGRLLRGGQQTELSTSKGATPITDGELASLKFGNERIFLRFANAPQLIWTKDDAAEDRFARRLNGIAGGASIGLFSMMAIASWIYQYRNADQEVIALEDEGFADVEIKMPEMEKPKEPEPPPEPIETTEPTPTEVKPDTKATPSTKPEKTAETAPAKPGVMDILNNIPNVKDSASNQNLTAALSNIKGVRVPGGAAGVKVSSLIGKGPTSGVQIGGAAGGLSTSGINSLIRKDGQAGALGGKGDRAVQGKVTTLARQIQKTGGELSKEEIQKVINQHIGEIQYCYEKALRVQPGLAGRVVLDWTVNPQGRVTVVKVAQSSLGSAEATNCMMGKLKTWKFPPPRGGAVTIVFPFVFNAV